MCRLSWNLGTSTSWNPQGQSRPVMGLLYLYCKHNELYVPFQDRKNLNIFTADVSIHVNSPCRCTLPQILPVSNDSHLSLTYPQRYPLPENYLSKYLLISSASLNPLQWMCLVKKGPVTGLEWPRGFQEVNLLAPELFFLILAHPFTALDRWILCTTVWRKELLNVFISQLFNYLRALFE